MRVITGTARGKRLHALEGRDVRPTPDRVKEGLFNIIQFEIEDRRVLDLFSGTGQIGIEAISRGARQAVFVDVSKNAINVIQKNLEETGFHDKASLVNLDFSIFLAQKNELFDIAFLDPPYHSGILERALPLISLSMNQGGTIICEHPSDEELPEIVGEFKKFRSYHYGKILLTLYRHKDVITG